MLRRTFAVGASALLIPAAVLAGSPQATALCKGGCDDGSISVRVSDETPASGQRFIVRGLLINGGQPAAGSTVKVQARRAGQWQQISGARVVTNSDGRFRVRLILQTKGERLLRVVGLGSGVSPTERKRFTVTVH